MCDNSGLGLFKLIRGPGTNRRAILSAFDLLERNGQDVRPEPTEDRKRRLAGLLRLLQEGFALTDTYRKEGTIIYKHACPLGSPNRARRSSDWLKIKKPAAPAVRRLEEEDWNG